MVFPPAHGEELRDLLRQPPSLHGIDHRRWRLHDLRGVVPALQTYSLGGLSRLLRRLKIRRTRGRLSVHSPDPAYQTKLDWIARARAVAHAQPERVRLLYADEFSLYRQPTLADVYAPQNTEPTAMLSHRSNTRYRYAGALDVVTGQVTWTAASRMGVDGLTTFLRQLRTAYPDQQLLLVWDNWPMHQHPQVLAVAAALGIELLWLPTYAPWTNPIEQLWRWIRQDLVHYHRLAEQWDDLKAQVGAFLDRFAQGAPEVLRYVGLLSD